MTDITGIDFLPITLKSTPPGGVDFWFLDLRKITAEIAETESSVLSQAELTRARGRQRNQHYFIATRLLLRKVLALYTGVSAQELIFSQNEHGKPFLVNSPFPIYFNLSHSGDCAVLAVSCLGELGVDLEVVRPRNYKKITERYFHSSEHEQLQKLSEAEGEISFYKLWTLKEAFFKALGSGISTGLDKACFKIDDKIITANFSPTLNIQRNEWQFHQALINPSIIIALAINTHQAFRRSWFDGNSIVTSGDS